MAEDLRKFIIDLENRKNKVQYLYDQKLEHLNKMHEFHAKDDDRLQTAINLEIKKQIEKDSKLFQASQKTQDNRINSLNKNMHKIKTMERDFYDDVRNMKSVRSNNNPGLVLSLTPVDNNEFMINVNNKCLTVQDQDNYGLIPCDANLTTQRFNTQSIYDQASFSGFYPDGAIPETIQPYSVIQSRLSGNCLTSEKDSVSLTKCMPVKNQQWKADIYQRKCDYT